MMRFVKSGLGAAAVAGSLAFGAGEAFAQGKELVFGLQCDRTGPTATVGTVLCPGYHDYIDLVNSKGGVEGYKIKVIEVDNEYKVPPAIEAHERFKKEGAVLEGAVRHAADRGAEQEARGGQDPRHLARLRHVGGGRRQALSLHLPDRGQLLVAGRRGGRSSSRRRWADLKGKKIAYLFYDNPAGKEPLPILEDLAKSEGFELRTFAVPAPGVEMGAQMLDITSATSPTSSSPTCSAARRRSRSRS